MFFKHKCHRTAVYRFPTRRYTTQLTRPSTTAQPNETLSSPLNSKPSVKYPPIRDLPIEKPKWPIFLAGAIVGVMGWAAFLTAATNQEKLSSSVFRSVLRALRADSQLKDVLGDAIRPQPEWYLNGDPFVSGHIGQLQGNIDMSFRVRGSKDSGTVYFTSIRKEKGVPFQVLRFRVICDDGRVVNVADSISDENTA